MPVPDLLLDDGSGIQYFKDLKKFWIPGQVWNDDTANSRESKNARVFNRSHLSILTGGGITLDTQIAKPYFTDRDEIP